MNKKYDIIYVIGDSHSNTFCIGSGQSPKVRTLNIGPRTLHSVGINGFEMGFDDYYIPRNEVQREGLWVLAFGEIDCRCHIWKQINENGRDEDEVLATVVNNLFDVMEKSQHQDFGVMSIVPAIRYFGGNYDPSRFQEQYPVIGPDEDRLRYVLKLNKMLKTKCEENEMIYVDVHSLYCDEDGYLIKELSDGEVHITNRDRLINFFENKNIV